MGRGYWLPPQHDNLTASDGFYIDSSAVYADGISAGWNKLLDSVSEKLIFKEKTFDKFCNWKTCGLGQSYFVLLCNRHVEVIAEDADGYVAVYAIIPETCEAPGFAKRSFPRYLALLKETLTELYPGAVSKRLNSQHIKRVG